TNLERTFDTADIARLQDRAKLHIMVDGAVADLVGHFAAGLAADTVSTLQDILQRSQEFVDLEFSISNAGAQAFGARPGTAAWSAEPLGALRGTIVLQAVGEISIDIVADIAERFTAAQKGRYMKRELSNDLRAHIFPRLHAQVTNFVDSLADKIALMFDDLSCFLSEAFRKQHDICLGSIDRASQLRNSPVELAQTIERFQHQRSEVQDEYDRLATAIGDFLQRNPETPPAQTGPEEIRRAHAELAAFDESAYDRGLRPERWRVCVLGGLRRGKSSLINAIAGSRVLHDETAGEIAFPVHVRYGPIERAHSLNNLGEWSEVEIESALDEATRNPVLIETPWQLPRQLVLVHAPAFDMGDGRTAEICMVAARAASEILCLFSRQLSDLELNMYGRVADLNKPMTFVHTLADNEAAQERREVVDLAWQYLRQRNVLPKRIFTVSTFEYNQARRAERAPAGWNELEALSSTVSAHAQEHMQRLARLERSSAGVKTTAAPASATQERNSPSFVRALRRLFRPR
ncbi:MAG: dynamin family protein, partial [Candidatus Eremiobacteraeota bacterium]|nr:dynamin family protein [Candidatus Eremiobacteraeota bacterium]